MLTIDEIEVIERDAKDEYVNEYGGSSYSPEVTKLCADWRELTAQLSALTAELLASAARVTAQSQELNAQHKKLSDLAQERDAEKAWAHSQTLNNIRISGDCDLLAYQVRKLGGVPVKNMEGAQRILQLEQELVAAQFLAEKNYAAMQVEERRVAEHKAQVAQLVAERDAARKSLCRVYQVMELPDGKHISDADGQLIDALIESGMYDDALMEG